MSESQLSQRATEETLPLRDAFAVLFFVSVGMLFDPAMLVRDLWPLLATCLIIVLGKPAVSYLVLRAFRIDRASALEIAAGRAQIGEFSFILAGLGVAVGILPEQGRDLILAGAMISILVNPACFAGADRLIERIERAAATSDAGAAPHREELPRYTLSGHAVIVGFGRVGSAIGDTCLARGETLVVIEENEEIVEALRTRTIAVLPGPAAPNELLDAANIARARTLFVAIPNSFEAGQFVEQARTANPQIAIVARAHSDDEVEYLQKLGANATVMGEREIAQAMIARAFG
jgi:CPA2 family monovalent cation:H+ antiporter-2